MRNNLKRLFQIVKQFSLYYWRAYVKLHSPKKSKIRAVILRETLENLGSVFIKFGQFLSLRPDFIPSEYCQELFYLLEDVPPFSVKDVARIIEEEFGFTPNKLFSSFKLKPFAAASFGQVHEACLPSGEKVAVKIQRPRIKELVDQDIKLMKLLAKMIDFFPIGPNKFSPMIEQFEDWTLEELDYVTEADYTEEFYQRFQDGTEKMVIPKVYRKFSTERVLTAEFIEGITLGKILLALRNKHVQFLNKLKRLGFSRKMVAEDLLKNSLRDIYLNGFFHADPHPANIVFTADRKLAYIDFGIVGKLDKKRRITCLRFVRSILYGDADNAFEALAEICDISNLKDVAGFKKEHNLLIAEAIGPFAKNERNKVIQGRKQVLGRYLFKTLRLLQKYKMAIPLDTLRYFRTFSTLDSTLIELYPEMEIDQVARNFRNVSLSNLIIELPSLLTEEKLEKNLLKWLNLVEKGLAV